MSGGAPDLFVVRRPPPGVRPLPVVAAGRALLLDLHSFMGPTEHDVCLGDRRGTSCAAATVEALASALAAQGLDVSRNEPFPGGYITRHYGRPPAREAVQFELRYPTYLDCAHIDEPGRPSCDPARIAAVQRRLRPAFEAAVGAFVRR